MKVSAKAEAARVEKIIAAVKVLMEYGLPDPVSPFLRDMDTQSGRPPREMDPAKISVPITSSEYRGVGIDLTAIAPDKILLAMFNSAWKQGFKEGEEKANAEQHEAMLEAFPRLKATIRELAEEVADKKLDEFKERFQR
jgi:hypothetical protein